jgi:hypothetical protein
MAVPLKEFAQRTLEQHYSGGHVAKCRACGIHLHETATGYRPTEDGPMCSACYYNELGVAIDERPLGVPRARGG